MKNIFQKLKKKENVVEEVVRKANIIDYTTSCWGNAFFVNAERKYGDGFYPKYDWQHRPDEGTIVFKADRENKKVWVARLHNVQWYGNPDDAFTSQYTTIKDLSELTDEEIEILNRKLDYSYGFSISLEDE